MAVFVPNFKASYIQLDSTLNATAKIVLQN